jgi:two-component system invasion response regulator UvrY
MKILLADDQEIMRYSFAGILTAEYPKATICQATCGFELEKMARTQKWDIIISDMQMPNKTGLDVLKQLRTEGIKTPFLIISICPDSQYAMRILKAGGNGYFEKNGTHVDFVTAIETILAGKKYLSPETFEEMASQFDENLIKKPHQLISDRELAILKYIASGKAVSEIAMLLSLSIPTIATYRHRLLQKMHLKTNAQLMNYAIINHLED